MPSNWPNYCPGCGYQWQPRGHAVAAACPNCGDRRVQVLAPPPASPHTGLIRSWRGLLLFLVVSIGAVGVLTNRAAPPEAPGPVALAAPTVRPEPTRVPPTIEPTPDWPAPVLTENARRAELATALVPTPAPTDTMVPVAVDAALYAIADQAARQDHSVRQIQIDVIDLPDSPRWEVDVYMDLDSDVFEHSTARRNAFNIHKALWTAQMPVGAVMVWVYTTGGSLHHPGLLLVNAQAGSSLMNAQGWDGVGPTIWADFLGQHTFVGADSEDNVWYEERGQ